MSEKQLILKRDSEISSLFKGLEGWEYSELKRDIEANGVKTPIIIAENGIIVDGYTRHKIWTELGSYPWDIPHEIRHYDTREEMIQDAINLNVLRRHLNNAQRAYFATRHLLPKEKNKAEQRKKAGVDLSPDLDEGSGRAYELAAKKVGLGKTTLRKAERVFKEVTDKTRRRVLDGKQSIDNAFQELERASAHEKSLAESGLTSEEFDRMDKKHKSRAKEEKERATLVSYYGNGAIDDVFRRMRVTSFETRKKYLQLYVVRLHEQAPEELKRDIIGRLEF